MTAAAANWRKPVIAPLTLADGLRRNWQFWLVQEKSDGCHVFLEHCGSVFNAERMPDGSHVINDLIAITDQDIRRETTLTRWNWLHELARQGGLPADARLSRAGTGVEFVEAEAGRNGACDIVVCKPNDSAFADGWQKIKFAVPSLVVVTALDYGRGSVELADAMTGDKRGKLPLRGGNNQITVQDFKRLGKMSGCNLK